MTDILPVHKKALLTAADYKEIYVGLHVLK